MPRRFTLIAGIFLVFILILPLGYHIFHQESQVSGDFGEPTILIDAGHGGEDGGAVAITGMVESHINLAIALKLEQLLLFYGVAPVLVRTEDISLHDETANTFAEKKSSDLKNRVAMVNQYENGLLVSIHQNSYTESQYSGAQVFYTSEGQALGEQLQDLFRVHLDPDNERVSKPVDTSLYLMNHVEVPALLVECGFLSNEGEAKLLASEAYQQKIACVLTAGLLTRHTAFT